MWPGAGSGFEGGESITLADIKVGDNVAGQGALKGGVFVPTVAECVGSARRAANAGGLRRLQCGRQPQH